MKKLITVIMLVNISIFGYVRLHKHHNIQHSDVAINYPQSFYDGLISTEPLQEDLKDGDLKPYEQDNFTITPVKNYKVVARILGKETYHNSQTHEILPLDLVLGWNVMSKAETVTNNHIDIHQSGRFYFWHVPNFDKISRSEIEINSANTHVGGIDDETTKQLENLSKGDVVYLEGYLVNVVNNKNHYTFKSSLTRADTGAGACEVLLVTGVKKLED